MRVTQRTRRMARQLFQFCRIDAHADPARVREVADRLSTSHRRGALAVLSDFLRMVRLDRNAHRALVESARPLPAEVRDAVQAQLQSLYGADLQTAFTENPALIGGMRVQVGSDVYDGSVRARLTSIEAHV